MLTARVIPCLDVKDGRVVKGINFVSLRDAGDPVEQARVYDRACAHHLRAPEITASPAKRLAKPKSGRNRSTMPNQKLAIALSRNRPKKMRINPPIAWAPSLSVSPENILPTSSAMRLERAKPTMTATRGITIRRAPVEKPHSAVMIHTITITASIQFIAPHTSPRAV